MTSARAPATRLRTGGVWLFAFALCCGTALAANPCKNGADGLGGTGSPHETPGNASPGPKSDGLGGSGRAPEPSPPGAPTAANGDGLGGTGIVGTITEFGSICVNGVRVQYDAATPVESQGRLVGAETLAIGQVVAVDASGSGPEVRARSISVLYDVIGVIASVDADKRRLSVMGQVVDLGQLRAATAPPGLGGTAGALAPGQFIKVSGLRRTDGAVAASFIARTPSGAASVMGELRRSGSHGPDSVHGTQVILPPGTVAVPGQVIRVEGRWDGTALIAARVDEQPLQRALARATRLELEGYIKDDRRTATVRLAGQVVQLAAATRFVDGDARALQSERRALISARVLADRRVVADRVVFERSTSASPGARRGSVDMLPGQAAAVPSTNALLEGAARRDRSDRAESTLRPDDDARRADGTERPGKVETPEKAENRARVETAERPEKSERPEKVEKPEKAEKAEKVEKPEKIEKPEKPEKPAKPEKPEKVQRPEKVERR